MHAIRSYMPVILRKAKIPEQIINYHVYFAQKLHSYTIVTDLHTLSSATGELM